MIFPSAGAHEAWQDQIKRDRDAARKADLAAMSMAAQQEIKVGMGSLPIHFRCVRDQIENSSGGIAEAAFSMLSIR